MSGGRLVYGGSQNLPVGSGRSFTSSSNSGGELARSAMSIHTVPYTGGQSVTLDPFHHVVAVPVYAQQDKPVGLQDRNRSVVPRV